MNEKALGLMGLMRKAGMIELGEMSVGTAVREHKAKLVLITPDASPNARSRAESFVRGRNIPLIELPFAKDEVSAIVGKDDTVMAAVTDMGFAQSFVKALGEGYGDVYDALEQRARRSQTGRTTGTRRNNA